MRSNPSQKFRDLFAARLFDRPSVCASGIKRGGVWWMVRDSDWFRPCWISIGEYSPGCIRVRSDINPGLPKSAWSFPKPDVGSPHKFELTFHESELDDTAADLIYGCCSVQDFNFSSPLFAKSGEIPDYAWTTKAEAHHNALKK